MSRPRPLLVLVVALLALAGGVAVAAPAPSTAREWQDHTPMSTARTEAAYAVSDGKLYVIGGLVPPLVNTPTVEVYDVDADGWTDGPPAPVAVNHAMAVGHGKTVVHCGGYLAVVYGAINLCFGLHAGMWAPLAPMPETRAAGAAVLLDGRIYVIGGFSQQGTLATTTLVYDIAADSWSTAPGMKNPREHLTAVVHGGQVYVLGGRKGSLATNTTLVERFDPRTGRWTTLAPMRQARSGHASAVTADGRVVALGGEATGEVFDSAEVYDVRRNRWSALPSLTSGRTGLGAGAVGTRVFTFFGAGDTGFLDVTQSIDLR